MQPKNSALLQPNPSGSADPDFSGRIFGRLLVTFLAIFYCAWAEIVIFQKYWQGWWWRPSTCEWLRRRDLDKTLDTEWLIGPCHERQIAVVYRNNCTSSKTNLVEWSRWRIALAAARLSDHAVGLLGRPPARPVPSSNHAHARHRCPLVTESDRPTDYYEGTRQRNDRTAEKRIAPTTTRLLWTDCNVPTDARYTSCWLVPGSFCLHVQYLHIVSYRTTLFLHFFVFVWKKTILHNTTQLHIQTGAVRDHVTPQGQIIEKQSCI